MRLRYFEDKQLNTLIHLQPSELAHTAVPSGELMAPSSYFNYEKKIVKVPEDVNQGVGCY